jgi:hypothetical protein
VSQQEPPPSLRIRDLNQWLREESECSGSALSTRNVADISRAFVALFRYLDAKLIHMDCFQDAATVASAHFGPTVAATSWQLSASRSCSVF